MSEETSTEELKAHVKDSSVWTRLLFMALFAVLYWVAEIVLAVVVLFQFLCVLFTGNKNEQVLSLGAQLSTYAYQIFRFLTYNSEDKPFPLGDWPSDAALDSKQGSKPARKRAPAKKKAPAVKKAGKAEEVTETEEKSASPD